MATAIGYGRAGRTEGSACNGARRNRSFPLRACGGNSLRQHLENEHNEQLETYIRFNDSATVGGIFICVEHGRQEDTGNKSDSERTTGSAISGYRVSSSWKLRGSLRSRLASLQSGPHHSPCFDIA